MEEDGESWYFFVVLWVWWWVIQTLVNLYRIMNFNTAYYHACGASFVTWYDKLIFALADDESLLCHPERTVSTDWKKRDWVSTFRSGEYAITNIWCLMSYALRNDPRLRWSHIEISIYMFFLFNDGFRHLGKKCSIA